MYEEIERLCDIVKDMADLVKDQAAIIAQADIPDETKECLGDRAKRFNDALEREGICDDWNYNSGHIGGGHAVRMPVE